MHAIHDRLRTLPASKPKTAALILATRLVAEYATGDCFALPKRKLVHTHPAISAEWIAQNAIQHLRDRKIIIAEATGRGYYRLHPDFIQTPSEDHPKTIRTSSETLAQAGGGMEGGVCVNTPPSILSPDGPASAEAEASPDGDPKPKSKKREAKSYKSPEPPLGIRVGNLRYDTQEAADDDAAALAQLDKPSDPAERAVIVAAMYEAAHDENGVSWLRSEKPEPLWGVAHALARLGELKQIGTTGLILTDELCQIIGQAWGSRYISVPVIERPLAPEEIGFAQVGGLADRFLAKQADDEVLVPLGDEPVTEPRRIHRIKPISIKRRDGELAGEGALGVWLGQGHLVGALHGATPDVVPDVLVDWDAYGTGGEHSPVREDAVPSSMEPDQRRLEPARYVAAESSALPPVDLLVVAVEDQRVGGAPPIVGQGGAAITRESASLGAPPVQRHAVDDTDAVVGRSGVDRGHVEVGVRRLAPADDAAADSIVRDGAEVFKLPRVGASPGEVPPTGVPVADGRVESGRLRRELHHPFEQVGDIARCEQPVGATVQQTDDRVQRREDRRRPVTGASKIDAHLVADRYRDKLFQKQGDAGRGVQDLDRVLARIIAGQLGRPVNARQHALGQVRLKHDGLVEGGGRRRRVRLASERRYLHRRGWVGSSPI